MGAINGILMGVYAVVQQGMDVRQNTLSQIPFAEGK